MGMMVLRPALVGRINQAFSARQIAATAARLARLPAQADVFDLVGELGLFELAEGTTVAAYRASLPIPALNQAILTLAFRQAVRDVTPLNFAIVSGHGEAVHVSTSEKLISVVLVRVDKARRR
ncbi:MAG: hypothetical protein KGJ41_08970 [Rhodospirillales bacterium]|nr:hypothetical protein [Rhodospirillales bacterium]MDE2199143.1 hypothetical protein [Rhodospirillales bacterium]MDE2574803.1 hypothetical protein [Rhodospirillales bacterium]